MSGFVCPSCGRKIAAAPRCPHCGAPQGQWVDELARLEQSIADLKARDAALLREQQQVAAQMQAALFQRDALAHVRGEQTRHATRPRRILRRRSGRRPPTADPGTPRPRIPRQQQARRTTEPFPEPPPLVDVNEPAGRPEASSREVQNVLLGLGALLLGVAAFVFAALAISSLDQLGRVAILLAATVLTLAAPGTVARRGLTATAETIATIGLLLVLIDGYALWTVDAVRGGPLSPSVFAGLAFAVTAAVSGMYAGMTGLSAPRYATIVAAQPIVPLLAYDWITSTAGWALVLAVVALVDLYIGRLLGQQGRLVLPPWLTPPPAPDPLVGPDVGRPESAPEEVDAVLRPDPVDGAAAEPDGVRGPDDRAVPGAETPTPPGDLPSARWLWELTWGLHALTVVAALGFATAALVGAATVPSATRAAATLILAAVVGLAGALSVRQPPLLDIAAGVLTLAVIGAFGRVLAVALPGRALLLIAMVIAVTGLGVRSVPAAARRGPQLASAVALVVIGVVVAGGALRAALTAIQAAVPVWRADLAAYPGKLAAAVGPADWQLAAAALLLTIAAVLSLPQELRREFAVAGAATTALAIPASLGLHWSLAPWPPLLAAIGIGMVGLSANSTRAAQTHVLAAGVLGLAAAGAGLARPSLTGAVLFVLASGAALVAIIAEGGARARGDASGTVGDWAAGGAAFALPGAVAGFVSSATMATDADRPAATPVLAATYLAVCATLGYAAMTQVAQRHISTPLALGAGFGALAAAAAGFAAPGSTAADAWVGALVFVAAVLLFLTPTIDAGRRADRWYDGADLAAAAATTALVATLARTAAIL
ncbi:MAG TPA: permease, partial [Micromonosporaceae bacterium]